MRHVISVLLQNEVGALTRMTGLFSTRGYNIDSLNVAPTDDPGVSRVTLVVSGSDAAIAQLNTQLAKILDEVEGERIVVVDDEEHGLPITAGLTLGSSVRVGWACRWPHTSNS